MSIFLIELLWRPKFAPAARFMCNPCLSCDERAVTRRDVPGGDTGYHSRCIGTPQLALLPDVRGTSTLVVIPRESLRVIACTRLHLAVVIAHV